MDRRIFFSYFIFLFNLAAIIGFWAVGSLHMLSRGPADSFIALGKLSGLLAVYFVLLQFVLMGRTMFIEKTFGLDRLSRIHHWNGYLSIFFILLHPLLLIVGYSVKNTVGIWTQFIDLIFNYHNVLNAFFAVLIFLMIVVSSIYIVKRKLKYESWYFVHLFTYLAVILAWGHQLSIGTDFRGNPWFMYYWYVLYIFVFGNVILFRLIRPIYLFNRHKFYVSDVVKETDDVFSIYISGKKIDQFKIKPGQFMILRFLSKGFWWQAHPFSLSNLPNGVALRVTMKKVGDFTSEIEKVKRGTKVLIDGAYGTFTKERSLRSKLLFIAGGIGITPIRSLIEESAKSDLVLLYSNRKSEGVVFRKELDKLSSKYRFPVHYFTTDEQSGKGRIDSESIKRLVKDIGKREVYVCGPAGMMDSVISMLNCMLNSLGVPSSKIHFERFSL